MTGEEYIERLKKIVEEHPNTEVIATDYGDDFNEGGDYECAPMWSERDKVISVDASLQYVDSL